MSYNVSILSECVEPFLGPSLAQVCPGSQFLLFMTLLDTFIRTNLEVSQLCNRVFPTNPADYYYDFIVIGGGSAGAVVAARLSDVPEWKVLLLEAGPDEPPGADIPSMVAMFLGTELDWQFKTTNEENACLSTNGSCGWPRGKNLGGSSVHNGMMYIRGHAKDYDDWESMGNEEWGWRDVLPHFMAMEDNGDIDILDDKYHSTGGPLRIEKFPWRPSISDDIIRAAEEQGFGLSSDLNGDTITGFTIAQSTSKNGVRVSSASAFLRPIRNRRNLHIALNATVTKILIEGRKAVGVQYIQDNELRTARSIREIIVSAGAIGSPHLLLLSGIGPKKHLKEMGVPVVQDLPGVGENLQNHVSYTLTYTINQANEYDLNWAAALEYVSRQRGPMSSTGMSQITGIMSSSYSTPDHPDLQFYFGGFQATCATTGQIGMLIDNTQRSISISPTNLHPRSRGFIHLADNNPLSKPIIQANYFQDPEDVAVLIEGIQLAISLMNSSELSKLNLTLMNPSVQVCSQFMYLSNEYWSCVIKQDTGPENHQAGSCKMGPVSDSMSVVSSKLKVHGIAGLRVADTSIMPKVTSGNTGAPAMMIGERVATFIKQEWLRLRGPWGPMSIF
ncbi:glucose dehydrogenase [FAD, quinone]-like isoform X1 [Cotesia glomerata]|nr:glucose dehydrogenase [FAD, quinone]-like isoform X1 [Cotesia glomerata]XP_044593934.1 glucose dehydrogenase [FAD, quinone]-like isoform X1 [Cotesia glomerata]XP_044593943.1 glucose dehydrogenase [FAD, quinone]-like isoform X1 [Cotesia glomerata]